MPCASATASSPASRTQHEAIDWARKQGHAAGELDPQGKTSQPLQQGAFCHLVSPLALAPLSLDYHLECITET